MALSREMFGPDVVASVTTGELRAARRRRPLHRADARTPGRQGRVRRPRRRRCGGCSRKSVVARPTLAAGTVLDARAPGGQEAGHRAVARAPRRGRRPAADARGRGRSAAHRRGRSERTLAVPHRKRKVCVVVTARPSYRRIQTALRGDPGASRSRAPARRGRLGAARPLRHRGPASSSATGSTSTTRVYMVLEGENLVTIGQVDRPRAARAGDGLRQPASPTSWSRSPTATRRSPPRSPRRT